MFQARGLYLVMYYRSTLNQFLSTSYPTIVNFSRLYSRGQQHFFPPRGPYSCSLFPCPFTALPKAFTPLHFNILCWGSLELWRLLLYCGLYCEHSPLTGSKSFCMHKKCFLEAGDITGGISSFTCSLQTAFMKNVRTRLVINHNILQWREKCTS